MSHKLEIEELQNGYILTQCKPGLGPGREVYLNLAKLLRRVHGLLSPDKTSLEECLSETKGESDANNGS